MEQGSKFYRALLETIRRKPQNTDEQKAEKKESARSLRMEIMLENARIIKFLITQVETNPTQTENELFEQAQKSASYLAHPESVSKFIAELIKTNTRVKKVIEKSVAQAGQKPEEYGKTLIEIITKNNNPFLKLKGQVRLDLSYPLAIILYFEKPSDFKAVTDFEENTMGLFDHKQIIETPDVSLNFPVILMNGYDENMLPNQKILEHEKGHAEHVQLVSALQKTKRKTVWLETMPDINKSVKKLNGYPNDEIKTLPKPELETILKLALERAKNEILALLKQGRYDLLQSSPTAMTEKNGAYNFFRHLNIEQDSQAFRLHLWPEYKQKLKEACEKLNDLIVPYTELGLNERIDLMRWVMAQIPLIDWPNQIEKSGFAKESKMLSDLIKQGKKEMNPKLLATIQHIQRSQLHNFIPTIEEYNHG